MKNHDPLQPHAHDSNPTPPSPDATIRLLWPDGRVRLITVADLQQLPQTAVPNCFIVSTGHGTSGPFTFSGVTLQQFMDAYAPGDWSQIEVVSGDGFGNRVLATELSRADSAGPILLAVGIDGRALTRQEGLVRLVVPAEQDDALRQVKWVAEIGLRP